MQFLFSTVSLLAENPGFEMCKTWVKRELVGEVGGMRLCCSMLIAGWSSKGATVTMTEDWNDLVEVQGWFIRPIGRSLGINVQKNRVM